MIKRCLFLKRKQNMFSKRSFVQMVKINPLSALRGIRITISTQIQLSETGLSTLVLSFYLIILQHYFLASFSFAELLIFAFIGAISMIWTILLDIAATILCLLHTYFASTMLKKQIAISFHYIVWLRRLQI